MQLATYSEAAWKNQHLIRQRVIHDGSRIHFNSSDYLGLSKHPDIIASAQEGLARYGVSSRGSGLVNGYTSAHQEFEQAFAEFTGFEAALLFPSGYMANLAISQSLTTHHDRVFYDQFTHASLIDGLHLGHATTHRFRHKNNHHLTQLMAAKSCEGRRYIMTNSVFSCDGVLADLNTLITHDASLIIDDAHGLAVLGAQGQGILDHLTIDPSHIFLASYPLSKGFGCYGGMLCGDKKTIDQLLQFARTYRYTTSIPAIFALAGLKALDILKKETWRREKLTSLIAYFNQHSAPIRPNHSITAIQAIDIGDANDALRLQKKLQDAGFLVGCLRPPSVMLNHSLIRITLTVDHTESDIKNLIHHLS